MTITSDISLRAVEPTDLDMLYRWENTEAMWSTTNNREPRSRYALRRYISQCNGDFFSRGELQLIIELQGQAVGYVELFNLEISNRRAEVGVLIAPEFQHQGIASTVLSVWSSEALKLYNLYQLTAMVPSGHIASVKTFQKAGYRSVAVLPQWLCYRGEWSDVEVFSLMSEA